MWVFRLMACAGCMAALSATADAAPEPAHWNLPGKAPHLIAHYVPWFGIEKTKADQERDWSHWKWDGNGPKHNPEHRRPDGLRDIASVYYPLIGTYRSTSRAVVRYHLKTAKAAGIQGLILDWNGRGDYTDRNVPLVLDEAARAGMKIAICYEEKLNFVWRDFKTREEAIANAAEDIRYIVTRYGSHPAYLKRNNEPLIIQFDGWGQGKLGEQLFSPKELQRILESQPVRVAYCRQGLTPPYHPGIPGAFFWWSPNPDQITGFANEARRLIDSGKLRFFANSICPGFDDSGVWGWGGGARVTPRAGLSLLRGTFDLAFTGNPEFIQIVTWNDFNEGTVIEPTRENGFQYLDALATWWGRKSGSPVDLDAIRAPFLEYAKTCSAAERAELPSGSLEPYLKRRPLTVEIPHYLQRFAGRH